MLDANSGGRWASEFLSSGASYNIGRYITRIHPAGLMLFPLMASSSDCCRCHHPLATFLGSIGLSPGTRLHRLTALLPSNYCASTCAASPTILLLGPFVRLCKAPVTPDPEPVFAAATCLEQRALYTGRTCVTVGVNSCYFAVTLLNVSFEALHERTSHDMIISSLILFRKSSRAFM